MVKVVWVHSSLWLLFLVVVVLLNKITQNGATAALLLTQHPHRYYHCNHPFGGNPLVPQRSSHSCLHRTKFNPRSNQRRGCNLQLALLRRRKQNQETVEKSDDELEATTYNTDTYSLGLRPYRPAALIKEGNPIVENGLETNHTPSTSSNDTDLMEQNETKSLHYPLNEIDRKQEQTMNVAEMATLDNTPIHYSKEASPRMIDGSTTAGDVLHALQENLKTLTEDVAETLEKDASFFKSWKYQPIHTAATMATTTKATTTTSAIHNDRNHNTSHESSEDVGNSTDVTTGNVSSSSSSSSSTSKRSTPSTTTPIVSDTRDISSFFQSWRYQPVTSSNNNKNQSQPSTSSPLPPPTLVNPNQTVLVTVADLQEFLRAQGYIRQSDLPSVTTTAPKTTASSKLSSATSSSTRTSSGSGSGGGSSGGSTIAFPQKTVMKLKDLRFACILCASSLAAMLATTVWPNLWLLGGITGGFYGSRAAVAYANATATAQQPLDATGPLMAVEGAPTSYAALTVLYLGRRLAQVYLYVAWVGQTLWFLYKTGQLSLEYYKQYAVLDDKFQIQSKLDAMNARFVQAKIDFDRWEKENEIGRKVLATLRTAWYIEEQSLAKRQRQAAREARYRRSRYRIVQFGWDVYFWMLHVLERIWNIVTGRANTWRGWTEFWNGVVRDLKEAMTSSDQWGSRLGSIVVAWMAVNAIGALFAISPSFLNLSAVVFAVLWPSWMSEVVDRADSWLEEVKAKGRDTKSEAQERSIIDPTWEWIQTVLGGGTIPEAMSSSSSSSASSKPYLNLFLFRRYDKNRYHYYRRADGTRRFYRTGNPLFGRPNPGTATSKSSRSVTRSNRKSIAASQRGLWPWGNNDQEQQKKQRKRRRKEDSEREQWGLFGSGGD